MKTTLTTLCGTALLALLPSLLAGCSCGFDCNSDDGNDNGGAASLTLGFSDSLPEELDKVVITVDTITLRRSGSNNDEVIETFTVNGSEQDTLQVDLMQYPGTEQLDVISNRQTPTGSYTAVVIDFVDGDQNASYVDEIESGERKELNVPVNPMVLEGLRLDAGPQAFTVEFGLAQSLTFDDTAGYSLTTNGVRVEDNATAATLSGQIDRDLFDTVSPCDLKDPPETGNRVYLYSGSYTSTDLLGDVYTSGSTTPPGEAIAPFAVASLVEDVVGDWDYAFGYLPAGDYTLAFSCDTVNDDSVEYDGLVIPLPDNEIYQIQLSASETARCDLPADSASDCTRAP